jgi:hypothetical protein
MVYSSVAVLGEHTGGDVSIDDGDRSEEEVTQNLN